MLKRYETFSAAVSAIYHHIQKLERDEMVKYGSKGVYAQYLAALKHRPDGLTLHELCAICDKDKAAVSRTVADMEHNGLLERKGGYVYRAKLVLTDKGMAAAEYVAQRACAAVDAVGSSLMDEERDVLYAALETIAGRLEQVSREGIPVVPPSMEE